MLIVPTLAVPNQVISIILAQQPCQIQLRQRFQGLFCDLYVNSNLVIAGVICENINRIVRSLYLGFTGDFIFIDNQGTSDPYYTGLGTRFSFCYLELSDLNGQG